jgi:hypothetical protein
MFVLTNKQKIGGLLSAAERELAYLKSQANPNQNEIAISERQVQRLREQYALFPED